MAFSVGISKREIQKRLGEVVETVLGRKSETTVGESDEIVLYPKSTTILLTMQILNTTPYNLDYFFYVNNDYSNSNYHYSYFAATVDGYGHGGGNYPCLVSCFANEHAIWHVTIGVANGYFEGVAVGELKYSNTTYLCIQAMRYKQQISNLDKITIRAIEGGSTQRKITNATLKILEL